MPYLQYTFVTGRVVEIEKKHSVKYQSVLRTRQPKKQETIESQKIINENNAIKNLRRIINTNFGYRDFHLVLTYRPENRPIGREEAINEVKNFLRRLRNIYRKAGIALKYILTSEYGEKSIHHHLVVPNINPAMIQRVWTNGRINVQPLDNTGQYEQLASYLIKQTRKTFLDPNRSLHKKRWCGSSNLIHPEPIIEIVKADSWREDPVAWEGYKITRCKSGVDDFTGYPYQSYIMVQEIELFPEVKQIELPPKKRRRRKRKQYRPIVSQELF